MDVEDHLESALPLVSVAAFNTTALLHGAHKAACKPGDAKREERR